MMIKVIATDIDGTITDDSRSVSLEVVKTFREIEKNGIKVILVSGNVLPVMLAYRTFIGSTGPIIAENGGILLQNNQIHKYFDKEPILKVYEHLKKYMPEAKRILTDRWRETSIALEPSLNFNRIKEILKEKNVRIERTGYGIHITHIDQNKLFGLKKALELMNLSLYEVLAIGDSENDVDMVKEAGIGAAVGNAWEILKENAKLVSHQKYGAGVVEILRSLNLIP